MNPDTKITFFYTDTIERQTCEPIAIEASNRGYMVSFSDNIHEKAEIGVYCQHRCYPENSKFSVILLHDLAQGHNRWPNIWINEPWSKFDVGILPGVSWEERWQECSWDPYARPKLGVFKLGWPKADLIFQDKDLFTKKIDEIKSNLKLIHEKTVIYAPSWENDAKQDDFVQSLKELPVNLLLKQAPWSSTDCYPEIVKNVETMNNKHRDCADNVHILDADISIMHCLGIADLIVSDESSVMLEGLLIDIPSIAVMDWLIPDCTPSRVPSVPLDFVIKTTKNNLTNTVKSVINNLDSHKAGIQKIREQHFAFLGNSSRNIMDLIESLIESKPLPVQPLAPLLSLQPVPFDRRVKMLYRYFKSILSKSRYMIVAGK